MYNEIFKLFGSKCKTDEILLLINGLKKLVRQGFYDDEFKDIISFCEENNIFYSKSKFKVILSDKDLVYGDFSNKGLVISDDNTEGMSFYYFSMDEKISYLGNFYELSNDQANLGLLLGYPECCVEYFIKNFSENNYNPEIISSGLLDLSKRDQDLVLISHFPCSEKCKYSLEIAKNNLDFFSNKFIHRFNDFKDSNFL